MVICPKCWASFTGAPAAEPEWYARHADRVHGAGRVRRVGPIGAGAESEPASEPRPLTARAS
jgi:hypothetical protein